MIETLNKDERELLNRVEEQDVVAHIKKLVEYQASDPRQQVKPSEKVTAADGQILCPCRPNVHFPDMSLLVFLSIRLSV